MRSENAREFKEKPIKTPAALLLPTYLFVVGVLLQKEERKSRLSHAERENYWVFVGLGFGQGAGGRLEGGGKTPKSGNTQGFLDCSLA